jgi:hypothetical protein
MYLVRGSQEGLFEVGFNLSPERVPGIWKGVPRGPVGRPGPGPEKVSSSPWLPQARGARPRRQLSSGASSGPRSLPA